MTRRSWKDPTRAKTIFALHAAATAAPNTTLEHVTTDGTSEVSSIDFWLSAVPSDRRARPHFAKVAANITAIAHNVSLQRPAPRSSRAPNPNPTQRVSLLEQALHAELRRLGEDRCTPKSMQTIRLRYEREEE